MTDDPELDALTTPADAGSQHATRRRPSSSADLRRQAEEHLAALYADDLADDLADALASVHELRVHQVELEMQNDELRRAQAELDVSRAFYLEHYDLAPLGYCTIDASGAFLRANLAAAAMLGVSRSGLARHRFSDFVSRTDQDTWHLARMRLSGAGADRPARSGGTERCELGLARPDGSPFWVRLLLTAADEEGVPVCHVVIDDINPLKAAEDALRESEQSYRRQFAENSAVMLLIDPADGAIIEANAAAASFYGHPQERLRSMRISDINTRSPREVRDAMGSIPVDRGRLFEFRHRLADGSIRDVEASSSVIRFGDRTLLHSIIHDVTERKAAEEALRASEEQFRAIADYTVDWETWFGTDGRIRWVNPSVERITGYPAADFVAMPDFIGTLVVAEDRDMFAAALKAALGGTTGNNLEVRCVARDGSPFWLGISWQPIFDARGGRLGVRSSARDITARKRTEAALRASEAELREAQRVGRTGSWTWDAGADAPTWSAEMYRIFDLEPDAGPLNLARLPEFLVPESVDAVRGVFGAALAGGGPFELEVAFFRRDGSHGWVLLRGEQDMAADAVAPGLHGMVADITDLRHAQDALAAERRHTDAILRTTVDGIHVFDRDGHLHEWNDAFREHLGYTEEEMRSLSVADWDAQLSPEELTAAFAAIAERPVRFETQHRRRDGSIADVEIIANRIEGDDLLLASARDITERKRADEALREVTDRLTLAVQAGGVGIWDLDAVTGALAWDDQMFRLYGTARDQFSGAYDAWQAGLHPDDRERGDQELQMALAGEQEFDTEFRAVWPDGSIHHIRGLGLVRRDDAGRPLRMAGTNWDITAQKLAEGAAREAILLELAEAQRIAHVGNWTIDPATGVVTWSDEMCRIFGLPPGSPVPPFADQARFFSAEAFAEVNALIQGAMATGEPFSTEIDIVRQDGTTRHLVVDGEVVRDTAGVVIGLRGTVADVTDLREARARLEQAQRSETVGRLAAAVAHDFNNQLAAIGGYADFLANSLAPDDARRDDVAAIRQAGDRAAALTRQLLAFGRRQLLRPTVLDPGEVVAGLAQMLRSLVPASVALVLPERSTGVLVRVDRAGLEQAIVNLVINARDALPVEGTLTIGVASVEIGPADPRLLPTADPGPYIRLAVSDTGSGIDPAILPHILEPFFTTKVFGQGSGLGLSSVDGFVIQSGGFLAVESVLGVGSTFSIHLPTSADEPATAPQHAVRTAPARGRETILLVDDEPGMLAVTGRQLRDLGYTVTEAGGAAAALAILEAGLPVDLLLTDIVMPDMGGRELAARLSKRLPGVPVLFMSGYDPEAVFGDGLLESGLPFLSKPFDSEMLAARVRALLDGRPAN